MKKNESDEDDDETVSKGGFLCCEWHDWWLLDGPPTRCKIKRYSREEYFFAIVKSMNLIFRPAIVSPRIQCADTRRLRSSKRWEGIYFVWRRQWTWTVTFWVHRSGHVIWRHRGYEYLISLLLTLLDPLSLSLCPSNLIILRYTLCFIFCFVLTLSLKGGVFASPSAASVLAAIRAVTGKKGCLLIIKNYTGFSFARIHCLCVKSSSLGGSSWIYYKRWNE